MTHTRIDYDAIDLDAIRDPRTADLVVSLMAEVEELRAALGQDDPMTIPGLTPARSALIRAMVARQQITRPALYSAVYGGRPDGGPDTKIIDTHLVAIKDWLWVRGFSLTGGSYGRAFVWGEGHRERLAEALAAGQTLTPVAGFSERPKRPPAGVHGGASARALLAALRDHGPASARDLGPRLAWTSIQVLTGLANARRIGRVRRSGPRRLSVYSITPAGLAWVDAEQCT